MSREDPRSIVKGHLINQDLNSLLVHAAGFHGHYCRGLAYGLVAGVAGAKIFGLENTGMEEFLAVVECNNCFVDGVQVASGCTLGNNALIYHDLGKMAVTFVSRKDKQALRLVLKPRARDTRKMSSQEQESRKLYERLVRDRIDDPEAEVRMRELSRELAFQTVNTSPEELFDIRESKIEPPGFAPVYDSAVCAICKEEFMETRGVIRAGKQVCLTCARDDTRAVLGRGIAVLKEAELR